MRIGRFELPFSSDCTPDLSSPNMNRQSGPLSSTSTACWARKTARLRLTSAASKGPLASALRLQKTLPAEEAQLRPALPNRQNHVELPGGHRRRLGPQRPFHRGARPEQLRRDRVQLQPGPIAHRLDHRHHFAPHRRGHDLPFARAHVHVHVIDGITVHRFGQLLAGLEAHQGRLFMGSDGRKTQLF